MIISFFNCFSMAGNALIQAFFSTLIAIAMALPAAYFFNRFHFWCKSAMLALVPLLCIMPSKIIGLGIQNVSLFNSFWAIVWAHAALNIPLAFYMLCSASNGMNPHWPLIAQELGATRWQAFKDIDLPFLNPTIISSAIIIFLLCFTSFSIPLMMNDAQHFTLDILVSDFYTANDYQNALLYFIARLIVLLSVSLITVKHYKGWLQHSIMEKGYEKYHATKYTMVWPLFFVGLSFIILLPIVSALYTLCDWHVVAFMHSLAVGSIDNILKVPVYQPIINSLALALLSGVGSVIIGYILCKAHFGSANIGKKIIDLSAIAVLLLGNVGCGILFDWIAHNGSCSKISAAILCHIILNYPFSYRIIKTRYGVWQPEWDLLARGFGARNQDRWLTLELPFLRTAFMQAFCISFGLSLTEVGAGSILADHSGITMPTAIRVYREHGIQHGVAGLTMILFALVLGVTFFMHRKER